MAYGGVGPKGGVSGGTIDLGRDRSGPDVSGGAPGGLSRMGAGQMGVGGLSAALGKGYGGTSGGEKGALGQNPIGSANAAIGTYSQRTEVAPGFVDVNDYGLGEYGGGWRSPGFGAQIGDIAWGMLPFISRTTMNNPVSNYNTSNYSAGLFNGLGSIFGMSRGLPGLGYIGDLADDLFGTRVNIGSSTSGTSYGGLSAMGGPARASGMGISGGLRAGELNYGIGRARAKRSGLGSLQTPFPSIPRFTPPGNGRGLNMPPAGYRPGIDPQWSYFAEGGLAQVNPMQPPMGAPQSAPMEQKPGMGIGMDEAMKVVQETFYQVKEGKLTQETANRFLQIFGRDHFKEFVKRVKMGQIKETDINVSDTVPALMGGRDKDGKIKAGGVAYLEDGEHVMSKKATDMIGSNVLSALDSKVKSGDTDVINHIRNAVSGTDTEIPDMEEVAEMIDSLS